ncbi:hypothetical protein ACWGJQ_26315 [Peribacillus simplex]
MKFSNFSFEDSARIRSRIRVLEESAKGLVSKHIPVVTEEENLAAFKKAVHDYISKGVTTSIIAGANKQGLIDLQRYQKQGLLPLRVTAMGAGFGGVITPGERYCNRFR